MKEELKEGVDYYVNEQGLFVFTEAYHLKRGYCCKSRCKHCPYNFKDEAQQNIKSKENKSGEK